MGVSIINARDDIRTRSEYLREGICLYLISEASGPIYVAKHREVS